MTKIILWSGRTSPLLYIDHYIGYLIAALILNYFEMDFRFIATLVLALVIWNYLEAKAMYSELTETHIYMREGVFERDEDEVALEDILDFIILQPPFFKFFGLGTVLMITDPDSDLQPCIKCVRKPQKLLNMIKRQAMKCGAEFY